MRGTLVTIVSTMSRPPPAIRLVQLGARTACSVAAAATERLPLAGRRSVTGIRRRSAAPCVEFSLGLAPPSYAIDALNVCVRRITRSVSMANWRACSFGSVATYRFGHARIDGRVLKLNTLLFCRLPVQFV